MKLTEENLKVFRHHDGYALQIMMPDDSGNYLHNGNQIDLNDTLITRALLLEQEIFEQDLHIKEEDEYFRLGLVVKDVNDSPQYFHSRKLNLNDIVNERMQLLV